MSHDYKNYAHLEGVLDDDPVISTVPRGFVVTFKLSVKEHARGGDGKVVTRTSLFHVEVGKESSQYAVALKKGTPIWIDASIRIQKVTVDGIDQERYILDAHRVYGIDYSSGKRGVNLMNDFDDRLPSNVKE